MLLAAYHIHHVCLRMPPSIYLIFYRVPFQKACSPQGRDRFLPCASDAGFCPCPGTSRQNWHRNSHHLLAERMVISPGHISKHQHSLEKRCWPLQEPAWQGWKAPAAHLQVHCQHSQRSELALSVYPLLAALYAGKQTALITSEMSAPSLLLPGAESNGVSGRRGVRAMHTGADTPWAQSSSRRWRSSSSQLLLRSLHSQASDPPQAGGHLQQYSPSHTFTKAYLSA